MRQEVEYFKIELTECVTMKLMKKIALSIGLTALVGFLTFSCSVQTTPSLLTATSNTQDTTNAILKGVPFAYDLALDTISYNSCVGSGLNSSGNLHGIKIGANEGFVDSNDSGAVKGGLKLRSDFLQYIAQNVKPVFPNTTVIPSQIQFILENSETNQNLMIQYAVRQKSDLTVVLDVIQLNGNNPFLMSRDGLYENALLSSDPVLTYITRNVQFGPNKTVLAEGPRTYNLGPASAPDPIEGSLGYSSSFDDTFQPDPAFDDGVGAGEQYSDAVRSRFNSGAITLAVTFGNPATTSSSDTTGSFGLNSPRRPEGAALSRAYGRAYDLGFATKNASVPSQRRNILNRVTEKNLETGSQVPGASWSCESIVIMKTNQWNNKKITEPACSEVTAADLSDPTNGAAVRLRIKKLRRHYSETLWGIGFLMRENTVHNPATRTSQPLCIVNKASDCYLNTTGLIASDLTEDIGVNYDAALDANPAECYLSRYRQMGVTYIGNKSGDEAKRLKRCPQFASICIRASTSF